MSARKGDRLEGKKAVVVGAGQQPGETIGNGRAMSILFAREGAEVLCVDRDLARAEETVAMINAEGGQASAFQADIVEAAQCDAIVGEALARLGRIDVLVNNVGVGGGGGRGGQGSDGGAHYADEEAFDRIMAANLKGMWLTCRAALKVMREQKHGAIVNISSLAAMAGNNKIAYEISKAGVNRLTASIASANAKHGVRCNAVMPGLMDTPMAVVGNSVARGVPVEEVRAMRNARVPMGKMGTAWDTAYAALFLASDEAGFITGAALPVDGGTSVNFG
jgi:NAD(P)-dependent dehydrogenase (short-subunit alcohol dehydrogenase family)